MKRRAPNAVRDDAGFTLIEMLVVLAILSGAVAAALTLARPSGATLEPKRTALEIASVLRHARSLATERNAETGVSFDLANRVFWQRENRKHRIPQDVQVTITSARLSSDPDAKVLFRFFADGSSSGGTIVLAAGGRTLPLEVDWLTGSVRLKHADAQ